MGWYPQVWEFVITCLNAAMTSTTDVPEERPVANSSENDPLLDHSSNDIQEERNIWSNLISGEIMSDSYKSYCELTPSDLTDSAGLAQIGIWVVSAYTRISQYYGQHHCYTLRKIH